MRHIHDTEAAAVLEEADLADGSVAGLREVRGDLGAIAKFFGRGDDVLHRKLSAGHVLEEAGDLFLLPLELLGVGEVLILAASATREQRATRLHAMRRGLDDTDEIDLAVVLVVGVNAAKDKFAGQGEGDEHDPAVHTGEALSEVRERINAQLQLLMIGEGGGDEFLGRAAHGAHIQRRGGR